MSRSVWTEADREIVRRMAAEGCSSGVICEALAGRVPLYSVKAFMKRQGLSRRGRVLTQSKRNIWTEAEEVQLVDLVRQGLPQKVIALQLGKSAHAVCMRATLLRERGIDVPKRPGGQAPGAKRWTLERCRHLLVDAQDATDAELAPRYNLTVRSLGAQLHDARKRLVAAGIDLPERNRKRWTGRAPQFAARDAEIERLWRAGATRAEIAARLCVTLETVKGVLQRRKLQGVGGKRVAAAPAKAAKRQAADVAKLRAARMVEAAARRLAAARVLLAAAVGRTDADLAAELGVKLGTLAVRLCEARRRVAAAGEVCPERWPGEIKTAKAAHLRAAAFAPLPAAPLVAPRPVKNPIPPVHLVASTNADALPCRIRLGGELLNINGTGATRDPAYHWRGTVRQARTLITRNALQGAVIEQLSTGAHGGRA